MASIYVPIELPINWDQIEEDLTFMAAKNFNEICPIWDALEDKKQGLTADEVSKITGRSKGYEITWMEHLHRAALLEKEENRYILTDENIKEIRQTFGTKAILASVVFDPRIYNND